MNKKRIILIAVAAVIIVGGGVWLFGGAKAKHKVTYATATIHKGEISESVTATGTIEPVTEVEVGTQVSGIIDKIHVDYNSVVTKGQLIAEMDRVTLQSELASQRAAYNGAKAEYEYQKKLYERNKTLNEKQLIAATDYEQSVYNYEKAKSNYESSQASLAKAERNLSYATITSPIDGVVISRDVEAGQTVASGFETPTLFTIAADLTQMQVVADVDEADIGGVEEGQRATFTVDAYPNDVFEGVVTQIRLGDASSSSTSSTSTSTVVTYEVVISAHNPDLKLKPRLTANVTIFTLDRKDVLCAPARALRFNPEKPLIGDNDIVKDCEGEHKLWTREGNTFTAHPVKIGISNGVNTEIISGINEGTIVVTEATIGSMPGSGAPDMSQEAPGGEKSPFMPGPPGSMNKAVIELQNIKRNFQVGDETVHALRGVSFTIREGEFVTIMGTSGSGKSTLLNTLGCLDTPTSGEYLLDGISVRTMSKPQRAVLRNRKIGFVFQSYNLLPKTTAVENVELPLMYNSSVSASERRRRAIEALQAVGLGDRLEHKSNQMSGGQMQRVAIARALVNNPAVILADEATGNLDTRTSFEILVLFQKLHAEGRTIIFVTHNPEIAQYSSRNIVLRDGQIKDDTINTQIQNAAEALAALPKQEEE